MTRTAVITSQEGKVLQRQRDEQATTAISTGACHGLGYGPIAFDGKFPKKSLVPSPSVTEYHSPYNFPQTSAILSRDV